MRSTREGAVRARRRWTPVAAAVLALAGATACSGPSVDDSPAAATADLQDVRDEVADLRDRVATLEDRVAGLQSPPVEDGTEEPADGTGDADDAAAVGGFFADPRSAVGERVTVRGQVTEVLATTDVASAFRIAGDVGDAVAVVSATPSPDLTAGDEVEVTGGVVEVDAGTFETDFGIAVDQVFADPQAWLTDAEGEVALAAIGIELLPAPAGG
ncbi:hypothetical protein [Modestobacter roseus]|uniref:DUF5666 domain-containing protein n=1 Tax=Modestobacter roseus TaxID=1181884 RepID=A0A562IP23_9ACTN|nr:hypothetical protein [Modestobacter roseus]MQA34404.1 hypothetical protein [Modestobacter roseus]TWH72731.1 hypothetical protein JD78_01253 [Modestobacter roseus]